MPRSSYVNNLDDQARAELLSYVVIGQLVAHPRTSEWPGTDHMVDLMDIWLGGNGAHCDWLAD